MGLRGGRGRAGKVGREGENEEQGEEGGEGAKPPGVNGVSGEAHQREGAIVAGSVDGAGTEEAASPVSPPTHSRSLKSEAREGGTPAEGNGRDEQGHTQEQEIGVATKEERGDGSTVGLPTVKEELGVDDRKVSREDRVRAAEGAVPEVKEEPLTNGEALGSTVSGSASTRASPVRNGAPAAAQEGQEPKGEGAKKGGNKVAFKNGSSHPDLFIYTVVTRRQAMVLREMKGGDAAILLALTERFGVKLVGRKGLGASGEEVLEALLKAKAKPGKANLLL